MAANLGLKFKGKGLLLYKTAVHKRVDVAIRSAVATWHLNHYVFPSIALSYVPPVGNFFTFFNDWPIDPLTPQKELQRAFFYCLKNRIAPHRHTVLIIVMTAGPVGNKNIFGALWDPCEQSRTCTQLRRKLRDISKGSDSYLFGLFSTYLQNMPFLSLLPILLVQLTCLYFNRLR